MLKCMQIQYATVVIRNFSLQMFYFRTKNQIIQQILQLICFPKFSAFTLYLANVGQNFLSSIAPTHLIWGAPYLPKPPLPKVYRGDKWSFC